jgi:hypothetical protein
MNDQAKWIIHEKSTCIQKWTDNLHKEAKRLFTQDGTHGNMLFCFNEESGLISINPIPPKVEHGPLNTSIINAVGEHDLYGVIFIGETWAYFIKEKDHTAFQLLDGEMKVSDLNDKDKKEIFMVKMESSDGDCFMYLNEILRDKSGVTLSEDKTISGDQRNWFILENKH